mgnify:CR=1 FL=1
MGCTATLQTNPRRLSQLGLAVLGSADSSGAAMSNTEGVSVSGHCYCGAIQYAVAIGAGQAPIFTAYCHCGSCRRAHAAPLYHVVCVDDSMFSLISGEEHLVMFTKPGGTITRGFCDACGTRMLNRFGAWRPKGRVPVAFFPNTLDEAVQQDLPDLLRPRRMNRADECVLDLAFLRPLFAHG